MKSLKRRYSLWLLLVKRGFRLERALPLNSKHFASTVLGKTCRLTVNDFLHLFCSCALHYFQIILDVRKRSRRRRNYHISNGIVQLAIGLKWGMHFQCESRRTNVRRSLSELTGIDQPRLRCTLDRLLHARFRGSGFRLETFFRSTWR